MLINKENKRIITAHEKKSNKKKQTKAEILHCCTDL